jgi:hypothetical protein
MQPAKARPDWTAPIKPMIATKTVAPVQASAEARLLLVLRLGLAAQLRSLYQPDKLYF